MKTWHWAHEYFGSTTAYPGCTILYGWRAIDKASDARSSLVSWVVSLGSRVIPKYTRTQVLQSIQVGNPSWVVGSVEPVWAQMIGLGPDGLISLEHLDLARWTQWAWFSGWAWHPRRPIFSPIVIFCYISMFDSLFFVEINNTLTF